MRATEGNKILTVLSSYPEGTRTSMLQDFEHGKRLELASLNGALLAMGKKYGLPTPVNEKVVALVKERVKEAAAEGLKAALPGAPANRRATTDEKLKT